ncbi:MAG: hypothetical protein LBR23_05600 [Spirochaetaceae bacterium]|nr:hypothetical protein [Spirochaetaceae bacterium]
MKPWQEFIKREALILSLLCLLVISIALEPSLLSVRHLRNILFEAAPLALLCSAFALSLLCGFLDFSFAGTGAFAGVACAALLQLPDMRLPGLAQAGLVYGVMGAILALCAAISCAKIYIVSALRIPPAFSGFFVGGLLQGFGMLILTGPNGETEVLRPVSPAFIAFGTGHIGLDPVYSLPVIALLSGAVIAGVGVFIRRRKWQDKYSIISSVFNSLYVPGTMMPLRAVFVPMIPAAAISGACYALGGMMFAAKSEAVGLSGGVDFMNGALLSVLAGAFAGKASIFGGRNNFFGAAGGMILITALFYALDFVLVPLGVQTCLKYVIIGVAVYMDIQDHYLPGYARPKPKVKPPGAPPRSS